MCLWMYMKLLFLHIFLNFWQHLLKIQLHKQVPLLDHIIFKTEKFALWLNSSHNRHGAVTHFNSDVAYVPYVISF